MKMRFSLLIFSLLAALTFAIVVIFHSCSTSSNTISFNQHIRPILNENCTSCHGGVKQNSGLSLLFRQDALAKAESGLKAIIPGKSHKSELIRRIKSDDPEQRMPPEGDALSKEEIALLSQWIDQGAAWETHWAYLPPSSPNLPKLNAAWANTDLDRFVEQKLEELELKPQQEADKYTLIRRASLDLTGLAPTPEELELFLSDDSEDAYENLLDRLLNSPHYGEKWAGMWLDLARYADSKGFEKDHHREIWRYRDWVINAFNRDLPFDQFSIEQLAGDLLPQTTKQQYIATGFHRNTMNNNEGGVQNEEYRMAAVIDRVNTTWDVWQSSSFGCAQCHNHPYDPFKQKEYYEYLALFNNTKDEDTGDDAPTLKIYDELQEEKIQSIKNWVASNAGREQSQQIDKILRFSEPKYWSYKSEVISKTATGGDDYLLEGRHDGWAVFKDFPLYGVRKVLLNFRSSQKDSEIKVHLDNRDGPLVGTWQLGEPGGMRLGLFDLEPQQGKRDLYFHFISQTASTSDNDQVANVLWILPHKSLDVFNLEGAEPFRDEFLEMLSVPGESSPVMLENPKEFDRSTFVLDRGSWMSPKEEVGRGIPSVMSKDLPSSKFDRLQLAQWMFSDKNPLTGRVIVNRLWEQVFGTGLVETLEDFGTQGEPPSHPGLLDYLAIRLKDHHQWQLKSFLKEVMSSSTYRQSSKTDALRLEKDPFNRYFSRGPRFRLSAEQIRDQALAVSGLLHREIGGRSVMPHLPEGAWEVVYQQYTNVQWVLSKGKDRYRRGLYTYWKRTAPYPSMITFDSQSREVCVSRRIRTNTPLQALVTLNDPVYLEAANALARIMTDKASGDYRSGIRFGYQKALCKPIDDHTLGLLSQLYQKASLEQKPVALPTSNDDPYQKIQLESPMAVVANAILNLDRFIMKD